ncbi:MAG: riboflavin synthase [Gemmatimonadetes bacterium]|nr:MAG: riboflavin synthase [Gemmatimonadota bacterium]
MFTGLVEEVGMVQHVQPQGGSRRITISARAVLEDLQIDNSINVNGACQTVIERQATTFTVQAVEETLQKTTLGNLRPGSRVNLERALAVGDRFGGHIVAGHVDCVGTVVERRERASSTLFSIRIDPKWMRYVVEQGSITVDGVSLTIAHLTPEQFTVSLIPYTLDQTTLGQLHIRDQVNIEVDILGKYIERLLGTPKSQTLTLEKLKTLGYS